MKTTDRHLKSRMNSCHAIRLLMLALTTCWLGGFATRSFASLSAAPSPIWLGDYVQVTVGAIGWVDSLTGQTNSGPSELGSGSWIFPTVNVSDGQSFSNLWSYTNVYLLSFPPTNTGTITFTAGSDTASVEVVGAGDLTYAPSLITVGTNVTFTLALDPSTSGPPSTLEWSTNVSGSGTAASGSWTNGGFYEVAVWTPTNYIYRSVYFPVFKIEGGWAESAAQCCGATGGGTNTFHVTMSPTNDGSLVIWSGGPLAGTETGEEQTISFTNTGIATITATCGSSFFIFTNKVVKVAIDPAKKTQYVAYGSAQQTNTIALDADVAFGDVTWDTGGLPLVTNNANSVQLLLTTNTAPQEYTITATSVDTGVCVDTAKLFVVHATFDPSPLVIPIYGTGQVAVAVQPTSLESQVIFTNAASGPVIATVNGSAPLLDIASPGTNTGTATITAKINGVTLNFPGKVGVFTVEFTNRSVDVAESGTTAGSVKIIPAEYADQAVNQLCFETEDAAIATISGNGTNFTVNGANTFGETKFFITAGGFTNHLDTATGTVVRVEVISTTMSGLTMVNLRRDSNGDFYVPGTEPHWTEGGTNSHPVAYKATTTTETVTAGVTNLVTDAITNKISAKFRVLPNTYTRSVHLKGDGGFFYTNKTATASGGEVIYPATSASTPFGSAVDKAQMTIAWSFALDGVDFHSAKESKNDYYLTLAAPPATFHTVLDVACRNSTGATLTNAALAGIWCHISSLNVPRVNGTDAMKYWGTVSSSTSYGNAPTQLPFLLQQEDGRCGAWAQLFQKVVQCHGITPNGIAVQPRNDHFPPSTNFSYTLLVKPIAAQGGTPLVREFPNHALVSVTIEGVTTIYDPSYGSSFSTLLEWEDNALEGVNVTDTSLPWSMINPLLHPHSAGNRQVEMPVFF